MNSLTITGIQADLRWEDKQGNLKNLSETISNLNDRRELIILPEMFNTGFSMNVHSLAEEMEGASVNWMREQAKINCVIVTGSLIIREEDHFYNRQVWMLPNGEYGYYDKRHLFAYASEHEKFSAGNRRFIASANGWKINLLICYDLRFPVWARQRISPATETSAEYDLLIYIANWPEPRIESWTKLLQARAIENQCFVAGVNRVGVDGNGVKYSGNSLVVDPLGNILHNAASHEGAFTCQLNPAVLNEIRTRFPFLKDADTFIISNPK